MKKNKIFIILVACFALTACQSIKEGLSGSKSDNNDEFLVKKKNPLVLPPKYLELPKPRDSLTKNEEVSLYEDDLDIQKILGMEEDVKNSTSEQNGNTEDFILKNIKKN
jgi:hypothetical protein